MMYRCSECGAEYDIKPEFCDCGNDVFTEVQGSAKPKKVQVQPQQTAQQTTKNIKSKKTFDEQYPEFERLREVFDPISTAIFLGCIIIGLLVIFVVGNPEKKEVKAATENENTQITENIPSIDSIWDNSTAGVINNEKILAAQKAAQTKTNTSQPKTETQKSVNPILAKVENEIAKPTPVAQGKVAPQVTPTPTPVAKPQPQPQIQQKSQPKTQTQTQTQAQSKPTTKTTTTTSNTPITSTQKTTSPKPNIPQNTQAAANQPKTNNTQSNPYTNNNNYSNSQQKPTPTTTTNKNTTTSTTTPKTQTQTQSQTQTKPQTQKSTQVPVQTTLRPKATIDTQALQKELSNYKVGLRNTIGRKIDFANVIGDGDCAISFNIASNGKLINRKFTKQSSNITLNDAVYKAVMATPSYNPPPSGYNNETMNLRIRFYNGNFDVTLN